MERIHVEITPKNLKFIRERKEKNFIPIKMTINLALDMLRKKEIKNGETV
jgi:hypothetical protein